MSTEVPLTHYRRTLPEDQISFSSARGRQMFRAALAHGTMEGWFPLAEQFHTQAEPAFCGLGSLVVALNALGVDPQRAWRGPWRWYSEELLDCCVPLPEVSMHGITLSELGCLARCNALVAEVRHADGAPLEQLRAELEAASRGDGSVVIAGYSRAALGQTGAGHFSPLAGLCADDAHALVLDVARFKYPPHWVALPRLHQAMLELDPASGRSRGWVVLRRRQGGQGLLATLTCGQGTWRELLEVFELPSSGGRTAPSTAAALVAALAEAIARLAPYVAWREPADAEHRELVAAMRRELRASAAATALRPHTGEFELAALVLLVAGPFWSSKLPEVERVPLASLLDLSAHPPALASEVELLRQQLGALRQSVGSIGPQ